MACSVSVCFSRLPPNSLPRLNGNQGLQSEDERVMNSKNKIHLSRMLSSIAAKRKSLALELVRDNVVEAFAIRNYDIEKITVCNNSMFQLHAVFELTLKALLIVQNDGGRTASGHSLSRLFSKLDDQTTQPRLRDLFAKSVHIDNSELKIYPLTAFRGETVNWTLPKLQIGPIDLGFFFDSMDESEWYTNRYYHAKVTNGPVPLLFAIPAIEKLLKFDELLIREFFSEK